MSSETTTTSTQHWRTVSRRAALGLGAAAATLMVARPGRAAAETVVRASDYGYDPVDSSVALQAALDSTADVVIIDAVGGDWITKPLWVNRSNLTIILEPGVTVRAKPGAFSGAGDCLLSMDNQEHITLVGYGAEMIMTKADYTTGEWRMGLSLKSVHHVLIEGVALRDSGGDGLYVGVSAAPGALPYCSDVTIRNVICENHRRNAISIISVDGLLIEGCAAINTFGTSPMAGIDFEPNYATQRLVGITVRDTVVSGNPYRQVLFALMKLDATSLPIDITLERLSVSGPQSSVNPMFQYISGLTTEITGSIVVRDCVIDVGGTPAACVVLFRKGLGVDLTMERCVFVHWGNTPGAYQPVAIMNSLAGDLYPVAEFGAVTLSDCVLVTDAAGPHLKASATSGQLTDLHGSLQIIGPAAASVDYGTAPVDVDIDVTAVAATLGSGALGATVTVAPATNAVSPGQPFTLTFTRSGGLLTAPLAVSYELGGSAQQWVDYDGTSGSVMFPSGVTSVAVTIDTRDADRPTPVFVVPAIVARVGYVDGSTPGRRVLLRRR